MSEMERLREVAEAATQADWWPYFVPDQPGADFGEWIVDSNPTFICSTQIDGERGKADAEHIATFDPPTVLALLDRLEAAEAKVARVERVAAERALREAVERLDAEVASEITRLGGRREVHASSLLSNWVGGLQAAANVLREHALSAPQPADAPEGHGDACEAGEHAWAASPRRLGDLPTREVCVKCGETREVEA